MPTKLEAGIFKLEEAFWSASADHYRRHLATAALMIFPSGIMGREEVIAGIASAARWERIEMMQRTVQRISESVVAIGYRARARRSGDSKDYEAMVGSVYVLEQDEWRLCFHQHAPMTEGRGT